MGNLFFDEPGVKHEGFRVGDRVWGNLDTRICRRYLWRRRGYVVCQVIDHELWCVEPRLRYQYRLEGVPHRWEHDELRSTPPPPCLAVRLLNSLGSNVLRVASNVLRFVLSVLRVRV